MTICDRDNLLALRTNLCVAHVAHINELINWKFFSCPCKREETAKGPSGTRTEQGTSEHSMLAKG